MTNAYLKFTCLTLGSPFSLHQVKENDYLIKARYIYTLTKIELSFSKPFSQLCIKKTFSLRKSLFFVLVLFLVLITAHFHCYTHFPHFRSASNQNTFKVLSLFVFRKTSNIKTDYKAVYKTFSLQILQLEKYENKYTIGFDLKISPFFEMIFS